MLKVGWRGHWNRCHVYPPVSSLHHLFGYSAPVKILFQLLWQTNKSSQSLASSHSHFVFLIVLPWVFMHFCSYIDQSCSHLKTLLRWITQKAYSYGWFWNLCCRLKVLKWFLYMAWLPHCVAAQDSRHNCYSVQGRRSIVFYKIVSEITHHHF